MSSGQWTEKDSEVVKKCLLAPAYGEVPAEVVVGGFAEDALIFAEFGEDGSGLGAEGGWGCGEEVEEGADGDEAAGGVEPLRFGEVAGPVGIAGSLLEKERHGVFVGGEELEERTDFEALGEAFECVLIAGQGVTIDEDIEARVFPFDDYIEACCHWFECCIEAANAPEKRKARLSGRLTEVCQPAT